MKSYFLKIIFFHFALLIFFRSQVYSQSYSWKQNTNLGGVSRWGAFVFTLGNQAYLGGGFSSNNNLDDLWQFNPATNSWTQKANIPTAVRTSSSFVIGGLGYVTGGISNLGFMAALWQYDPIANVWLSKASFPGVAIYGAVGFSINNFGYFGIGNGGSAQGPYFNDFYEYNPVTDSWLQKATFPGVSRYGTYGISLNGKGYVGFGVNENTNTLFNDWWEYDQSNNQWTIKSNYPGAGRSYPAGFILYNKIFIGTGQEVNTTLNDFYSYDPLQNNWSIESSFAGGIRWLVAGFSINGKGYFSTGSTFANATSFNDLWEYSMDSLINCDSLLFLKPNSIDGKDALILSGLPTTNTEPETELMSLAWTCGGLNCVDRALIEFNLSPIPSNAIVLNARLNLYSNPNPVTVPQAMFGNNSSFVQRITSPWNESTVTWSTQPTVATLHQVVLATSSFSSQDYLNIDVTDMVQDMVMNPSISFGFMIRLQNETNYKSMVFASSDYADSTVHPSLEICYTIPSHLKSDISLNKKITISPNPFNKEISIRINNLLTQNTKVEIVDLYGNIISRQKIYNQASGIEMFESKISVDENIANGIYLLKIYLNDSEQFTKKIIKY